MKLNEKKPASLDGDDEIGSVRRRLLAMSKGARLGLFSKAFEKNKKCKCDASVYVKSNNDDEAKEGRLKD